MGLVYVQCWASPSQLQRYWSWRIISEKYQDYMNKTWLKLQIACVWRSECRNNIVETQIVKKIVISTTIHCFSVECYSIHQENFIHCQIFQTVTQTFPLSETLNDGQTFWIVHIWKPLLPELEYYVGFGAGNLDENLKGSKLNRKIWFWLSLGVKGLFDDICLQTVIKINDLFQKPHSSNNKTFEQQREHIIR